MTPKIAILKICLTRNTRIAYNILTVFTKPFNRTSMESKLDPSMFHSTEYAPFNRTSMESKHVLPDWVVFGCLPFNRTSMESKRGKTSCSA